MTIDEMINEWKENHDMIVSLSRTNKKIERDIFKTLKEWGWKQYTDKKTKVKVSLITEEIETIDMQQLRMMLTINQMENIKKKKFKEKLLISSEKERTRLSKYVVGKTKKVIQP